MNWKHPFIRAALCACALPPLGTGCAPAAPPTPEPAPAGSDAPVIPTFTQSGFNQIMTGMSYSEVSAVLGAESTRQESTYNEGTEYVQPYLTVWHYWENPDGSHIKVGFINKRVTEKSSENLPN